MISDHLHIKRIALQGLLVFSCCACACAQWQRGLKGEYDISRYPVVSFIWNTANPEVLSPSQFGLIENGQRIDVDVEALPLVPQEVSKDILFLWEDLPSHRGQFVYFRNVLKRFFSQTAFSSDDRFNIALFNRKGNSGSFLQMVVPRFQAADGSEWIRHIERIIPDNRYYAEYPNMTDLYLAINDGIDLLKQEKGRVGVIVVLTAGLNIKAAGATTEMGPVMQKAKAADIPVYVIKYPLFGNTPEINTLSEETYGKVCASVNEGTAYMNLQEFYNALDIRGYGRDYRIKFRTMSDRDGQSHPITLTVDKETQYIPPFNAPDMTLGIWIKKHPALFVVLLVLVIAIGLLIVFYIRKQRKTLEERVAETEREAKERQKEIERRNAEEKADLDNQLDALKKAEQEREAQRKRQALEQERERLEMIMHNKNLYPRMQCRIDSSAFDYVMKQPEITIGRLDANDVVLNDKSVSRYHAKIKFTGKTFSITDSGSTNGILVNGVSVRSATLKNSDVINLGKAKIVFYI